MNQEQLEAFYRETCQGREDAYAFICAWQTFCSAVDDLNDGDIKGVDALSRTFFVSIQTLTSNFWQQHGRDLYLLSALITNDYIDSHNCDVKFRDFLRSNGNQMLMAVAFICGGFDHLRKMSLKIREISYREHHDDRGNPI